MALSSYFSLDGINIPSKWPFFKYSKAVKMISLPQGVNIFFFSKALYIHFLPLFLRWCPLKSLHFLNNSFLSAL